MTVVTVWVGTGEQEGAGWIQEQSVLANATASPLSFDSTRARLSMLVVEALVDEDVLEVDESLEDVVVGLEDVEDRLEDVDVGLEVDGNLEDVDVGLQDVEERLEDVDVGFEDVEERLEDVDEDLRVLEVLLRVDDEGTLDERALGASARRPLRTGVGAAQFFVAIVVVVASGVLFRSAQVASSDVAPPASSYITAKVVDVTGLPVVIVVIIGLSVMVTVIVEATTSLCLATTALHVGFATGKRDEQYWIASGNLERRRKSAYGKLLQNEAEA